MSAGPSDRRFPPLSLPLRIGRTTVALGSSCDSGVVGTAVRFWVVVVVAGAVVAVVAGVPALAVDVVAAGAVVVVAWASMAPFWAVIDVDPPAAVVVVAPAAVVVVAPGAVVAVGADDDSGGSVPNTGRNRSSDVCPTMSSACCWF